MKNEERLFMIFLLLIMLPMVALGSGYDAASKILPMASGIFSSIIVVFLLIMSFSARITSWYQKFETRSVLTESVLSVKEKKRELSVIAWFSGCTVAIYFLGFLVAKKDQLRLPVDLKYRLLIHLQLFDWCRLCAQLQICRKIRLST